MPNSCSLIVKKLQVYLIVIQAGQSQVCDDMRRTKDNHVIVGYFPSGEFINYADKKMQNPPRSRMFRHHSDTYQV